MVLPIRATPESQERLEIARFLLDGIPIAPDEADAVLVGSSARGVADHYSGIELYFWTDDPPDADTCETLLAEAGVDVESGGAIADGSVAFSGWFEGVLLETIWQTRAARDEQIRAVLAGEVIDHDSLVWLWQIVHALPLNAAESIRQWQRRLRSYPEALRAALIADAAAAWAAPTWYPLSIVRTAVLGERAAARSGGVMALSGRLHDELERMLRVLFAINRQWEPDFRWISDESERLPLKPPRLLERMDQVFSKASPIERTHLCLQLILDTLRLVPDHFNVARARNQVEAALYPERLLESRGSSSDDDEE